MVEIRQAVIFAGGRGERLKPFTETNPNPMYRFNGRPFLEYLVKQVRGWGIREIIMLLGYLPEKIMDFFGDGSDWDVNIRYVVTPVEYDTQYRLKAAEKLLDDDFLMMYCDNLCPINFPLLMEDYERNHALIQVTAYANDDLYTKSNMKIGDGGIVEAYDKKRIAENLNGVDIGYALVSRGVISWMSDGNDNFEAVVYPKLVDEGKLFSTVTEHRYYSIGSFARIELTERFLSGQKYIFLDRDGVMNKRPPKAEYVRTPDEFIWLDGAKEAVKKLNDAGYFIIMVSNQAGIAKGVMTHEDFQQVQKKMTDGLAEAGAHIDAVYYCPHGWDEGCRCRKPKPGMLYQAQKDFSIDLTGCVLIGDDERDIMTAHNAGMEGILVTDDCTLLDAVNGILSGRVPGREEAL